MYEALSDTKNAIAFPISSGSPARLSGIFGPRLSQKSFSTASGFSKNSSSQK